MVTARFSEVLGRRCEHGVVAVWMALMMPVLLGVAALAVDVGLWQMTGARMQKAADAAALAGVAYLPASPDQARATAVAVASTNGFTDGVGWVSVTAAPVAAHPSQLKVSITGQSPGAFGGMFGIAQHTLTRTSVADYAPPLQLGSPCNEFGSDPDPSGHRSSACGGVAGMWAGVNGRGESKDSAEPYQSGVCDPSKDTDGCSGTTNLEYDPNGYYYRVHLTQRLTGSLYLQAYDPGLVDVGNDCTDVVTDDAHDLRRANNKFHRGETTLTADDPYAPGPKSAYCNGDTDREDPTKPAPKTTFTVLGPGTLADGPAGFPTVSGATFDGFNLDPNKTALFNALNTNNSTLAPYFRQWVTLAHLSGNLGPGDYLIQVSTTNGGQYQGRNYFSLRAYSSNSADDSAISISGYGKMSVFANTPNGDTNFYLTRLPASAAGKSLTVRFFDLGDNAATGSYLKILPPDPTINATTMTSFSGCTGQGPVPVQSNCRVDFSASTSSDGKWETLNVPIPPDYTCAESATLGCWVRLHLKYAPGSAVNDGTTWTASLDGDPVRLVQ